MRKGTRSVLHAGGLRRHRWGRPRPAAWLLVLLGGCGILMGRLAGQDAAADRRLTGILERAKAYCLRLEQASLDLTCVEKIEERTYRTKEIEPDAVIENPTSASGRVGYSHPTPRPRFIARTYVYDCQFIRKGDRKVERRMLIEKDGRKKNGLRFPSKDTTEEGYLKKEKTHVLSRSTILYLDYKFFTVETEVHASRPYQQTASTVEPPRTVDTAFAYAVKDPAYPRGKGPVVLVDEAHHNFHTAEGTYRPFADLLRQDGYVVERAREKISAGLLTGVTVYVIADAQPPSEIGAPPIFSEAEIRILNDWVKNGGALFLITDHMPDPGAVADLALSFGIEVSNGYVMQGPPPGRAGPTVFRKKDGTLADHFLTQGRGPGEDVSQVATFSGSALRCGEGFQPLLILGQGFRSWMPSTYHEFPPGTPSLDVSGWSQGGVRSWGKGRVATFAEAAMFTAQIFDNGRVKAGMNHPLGQGNIRLLLNIMHWLSGLTGQTCP